MEILKVLWWEHTCPSGDISSAKVHGSLEGNVDPKSGKILEESKLTLLFTKDEGKGELKPEILDGF